MVKVTKRKDKYLSEEVEEVMNTLEDYATANLLAMNSEKNKCYHYIEKLRY